MDNAILAIINFFEAIAGAAMFRVFCYVIISGLFALRAALRSHYRFVFFGLAASYGVAVFFALSLAINGGEWLVALRGLQTFTLVWVMAWGIYYALLDWRTQGLWDG